MNAAGGATPLFASAHNGLRTTGISVGPGWGAGASPEAQNGHLAGVRALVAAGADKDTNNSDGASPLSIARDTRHEAVVKFLTEAGAV
ncbi:hypothetical protein T484DRAFT_1824559 [Baffinella frigidus]|nr:hypothetical protein T484DRAFT_1824559 [Cryptophyta sp. CCMP2293]